MMIHSYGKPNIYKRNISKKLSEKNDEIINLINSTNNF